PSVPPGAARGGDGVAREVPTVRADAPLGDVLAAVISTRLNRAVVVDDAGRPVGVITDAELLRRLDPEAQAGLAQVLMRRLPFRHGTPEERAEWRFQTGTRAADLMLTPVVTVTASTPIPEAIRRMVERRYKILPVVDDEGRLIGMVDRADLLRAAIAG
ncbi:MAG: CBS domain-containing protein, partial [Thermomicrobiaceae bacterium]|nr:CBS domain-containing protein [Thermomicrobiaceae bacterium]